MGVFNTEEGFYAVDDVCTHKGGPLSDGQVASMTVSCPLHNQRVELKTGEVMIPTVACCISRSRCGMVSFTYASTL